MAEQVTTYQCPACDGPLRFDGKLQKLKCDYCDSLYTVEEVEKLLADKTEQAEEAAGHAQEMEVQTYICTSCGAALDTDPTTAVTSCPYCGNPTAIAGQMSKAVKPDYVIPFRLEKKDAVEALKNYYHGKRLLPKSFTENNHIEEIQGVYVPFWLFSAHAQADMRFEGRDSTTMRRGDEEVTETKIYDVRRKGSVDFTRIPADGSSKMPDDLMDSIEPFDYQDLRPFSMAYLPGFLANRYDVTKDEVRERVLLRAENTTADEMRASVHHDSVTELDRKIRVDVKKIEYAVFPVWLLSTRWNDENFLFAMNGQTGKMIGNLPVDRGKAVLYFALITLALGVIFSFFAYYM